MIDLKHLLNWKRLFLAMIIPAVIVTASLSTVFYQIIPNMEKHSNQELGASSNSKDRNDDQLIHLIRVVSISMSVCLFIVLTGGFYLIFKKMNI